MMKKQITSLITPDTQSTTVIITPLLVVTGPHPSRLPWHAALILNSHSSFISVIDINVVPLAQHHNSFHRIGSPPYTKGLGTEKIICLLIFCTSKPLSPYECQIGGPK